VLLPESASEVNTSFQLPLASYPSPALPLGLHVASHLLTHLFLSPLELIRTRLIVQPSSLPTSQSSPSMLKSIVKEEGGLWSLYMHPHLFWPSVLEHTIRPLLTLSIPLFIERKLHISPDISPITHSLLDLSLGLSSLLILLPIETVRKRLQIQDRARDSLSKRPRRTIVRTRERNYVGIVEAMWRIASEETTIPRRRRRADSSGQTEQYSRLDGLKQLYRGVSLEAPAQRHHVADYD
jgi:fusion and transport protein UGO1